MKLDFIPMGFQYYRAPTPARSEWERDLSRLAADGYNTVKLWLQWRWNQPAEEVYDFSDADELMRLCQKYGLKVVLNLILDVSPVWLTQKYPDSAMITARGQVLSGYATSYRQIGGVPGPCFHHPGARAHKIDFIRACAERYAHHPALLLWDVWNEPELTVGLLRQPKMADLVCYCGHSAAAFRVWLEKRYGSIARLNQVWGRNYLSFADVEPPRNTGTTADLIDWREFFCDTVTEDFRLRVDVIREIDGTHPVMCHTVPSPIFNAVSCCSDDFAIGAYGDMVGNSVGSDPMAADLLGSAGRGNPMINSEIHAAYGSALNGFRIPDVPDLVRHIFIPLAHGSRGFLFWQYRPELLGNEAPAWGHAALDGGDTEWNALTRDLFSLLSRHEAALLSCPRPAGEVAVYVDRANEIHTWGATDTTELTAHSISGAYQMLYRNNYAVDFLCARDVEEGRLSDYRAVYFPAVFLFDEKKAAMLRDYVEAGGTAVIEALFGEVDQGSGRHSTNVPGCGIGEWLGKRIKHLYSSAMIANGYDGKVFNAGDWYQSTASGGERLYGGRFHVTCTGSEGEVEARTDGGQPSVSIHRMGRGRVIHLSTLLSFGYAHTGAPGNAALLRRLIGQPRAHADAPLGLRVDRVGNTAEGVYVLDNTTAQPQSYTLPEGLRPLTLIGEVTAADTTLTVAPGQAAAVEYGRT